MTSNQLVYLLERRNLAPLIKWGIEKLDSRVHKLESDIVPKSCPQRALSCLGKESEEKCLASTRNRHPTQESWEVLPAWRSVTTEVRPYTSAALCSIHRLSRGTVCPLKCPKSKSVKAPLSCFLFRSYPLLLKCWVPLGQRDRTASNRMTLFLCESSTGLLLSCRPIETQAHSISYNRHLEYHILRRGGETKGREGAWVRAAMHHQETTQWMQSRLSQSGPTPELIGPFEIEMHSISTVNMGKSCTL